MSLNLAGFFKFAQSNVDTIVKMNAAAAKGCEQLAKNYADVVSVTLQGAVSASKQLVAVKSPTELFKLQTTLAKASVEKLTQESKKTAGLMLAVAKDVAQPVSERIKSRHNGVVAVEPEAQQAA